MSLGGRKDRAWLTPVDPTGALMQDEYSDMVGCHPIGSNTEGLNIQNARPDTEYIWGRNDPSYLRTQIMRRGFELVGSDDPEVAVISTLGQNESIDTTVIKGDIVLMRRPLAHARREREREQQKSQGMLRSGSDEFLRRVTSAEAELDPRGRGTRFAESQHRIEIKDQNERTVDSWDPSRGILR